MEDVRVRLVQDYTTDLGQGFVEGTVFVFPNRYAVAAPFELFLGGTCEVFLLNDGGSWDRHVIPRALLEIAEVQT